MRIALISFSDLDDDPRIRRQVEAFLAEGWEVHALVTGGVTGRPGLTISRTRIKRKRGGRGRYVLEYLGFGLRIFAWATALVARSRVDVIFVNSPPEALTVACVAARLRGVPVILDIHDPMPELLAAKGEDHRGFRAALELQERMGIRLADHLITVHEPMRAVIGKRNPDREISVVMNVPDLAASVRTEQPSGSRTVVFAGTVAYRYGLDDLVRGMASAMNEIPGLSLLVIGDGEDLERLTELAGALGVPIETHGRVPWEDVAELQKDAWVGANVPKPEPLGELSFSNKVVEWVAAGIPVLASRTTTLQTYFPEGTLFYADPGSPDSIAATLLEIHKAAPSDIERRRELALEALEEIGWPIQRKELLRVVRESVQSG